MATFIRGSMTPYQEREGRKEGGGGGGDGQHRRCKICVPWGGYICIAVGLYRLW